MALLGAKKSTDKRNNNDRTVKFKAAMEKALQRSLRTSWMMETGKNASRLLQEDVKKGHFSVLAVHDGNAKKYVVPLCYLNDPSFLRLLEKAAEEFGFEYEGALCVPCGWNELDGILGLGGRY